MTRNRDEITLFVPAANGVSFLFVAIDVAHRLASGRLEGAPPQVSTSRIRIVRLPTKRGLRHRAFRHILQLAVLLPTGMTRRLLKALPPRYANWIRNADRALYPLLERGRSVRLTHNAVVISIDPLQSSIGTRAWHWLCAYCVATRLWCSCFVDGRFKPARFLDLAHSGANVGLVSASESLRGDTRMAGSLRPTLHLFTALAEALRLTRLACSVEIDAPHRSFVMVPEATYTTAVYEHVLRRKGCRVVSLYSYKHIYKIVDENIPFDGTWIVQPREGDELNDRRLDEYMNQRLDEPARFLSYMENWVFDSPPGVFDVTGRPVELAPNETIAVVFLHSFSDGQYYYGLDGFDDIFHWTVCTVNRCLANASLDRILIKLHPGIDLNLWPCDRVGVERLRARFGSSPRCLFIDSRTPIRELASHRKIFGITHHGSVAEEMVLLGQPMIGSRCAPWTHHYPFLHTWTDPESYGQLLDGLSPDSWRPPSDRERAALRRFIEEYRTRGVDHVHRVSWISFAEWLDGEKGPERPDAYLHYSRIMEQLAQGEPDFEDFLDHFVSRPV